MSILQSKIHQQLHVLTARLEQEMSAARTHSPFRT